MTKLELFLAELTKQYAALYESDADTYAMAKARYTPAELAEKMTMALKKRDGNKDGEGIKRTCKALGIKYTYSAIQTYLS